MLTKNQQKYLLKIPIGKRVKIVVANELLEDMAKLYSKLSISLESCFLSVRVAVLF